MKISQTENGTSLFTNKKRLFNLGAGMKEVKMEGALAQCDFLDVFDGEDFQIALITHRSKNEVYVVAKGK